MENFEQLLEESLKNIDMRPGAIVTGTVVSIEPDFIVVNAGLKTEGIIPAEQFRNSQGQVDINIGDEVAVALDAVEDGFGETRLSREKAKRAEAWIELTKAHEENATVFGLISGKVKGGFTVELHNIRAFLPGSLVDVRPVRDTTYLEGKELEFKVIKIDPKRNNVVVSRRSVIEAETQAERDELLKKLEEGQEVKGVVKNLTDYGAFIDLGGVDGLLHITDMSWKRIKHPSEILNVADEIMVKILRFDRERNRVSLGLKQLGDDPWADIAGRYPENSRLKGKVTNLTDYGCFVELQTGVEGLVHVSEMDWTNKNVHPSKIVSMGDEVEVMVLEIDPERRRISLGIKQCIANPWEAFSATHSKGNKVKGKIKSITDFGIFIGLDGNIDGLVHLSDISWGDNGEDVIRDYKKGDEIEAVVLSVDADRERIALGVKQLEGNPFEQEGFEKGKVVVAKITEIDAKGMKVQLAEGVDGYIRINEISRDRVEDISHHFQVGGDVEAKVVGMDKKNQLLTLSIKAKDADEEAEVMEDLSRSENKVSNTLGDLLKGKISKDED